MLVAHDWGGPLSEAVYRFRDGWCKYWCIRCEDYVDEMSACQIPPFGDSGEDLESPGSTSVGPSATDSVEGSQIFDAQNEATDVLVRFLTELQRATGDGSRKRKAGGKPPWYRDDSHEGAIFSHLTKWKRGELVDPDSGAHPLVHAAWRCLAIACRESGNIPSDTP